MKMRKYTDTCTDRNSSYFSTFHCRIKGTKMLRSPCAARIALKGFQVYNLKVRRYGAVMIARIATTQMLQIQRSFFSFMSLVPSTACMRLSILPRDFETLSTKLTKKTGFDGVAALGNGEQRLWRTAGGGCGWWLA